MATIDITGSSHQYAPGVVMESKQSAEASERQLLSILLSRYRLNGTPKEKLKLLRAKKVDENVFIVGTDRVVSFFYDEKGDMILNLQGVRKAYYFQKASFLAGYREIPSDTQPVNLYHIRDIDNKGNPIPGAKPIDKFSQEYYRAFMEITFYDDRLILETFKKPDAVDKPMPEDKPTFTKIDDKFLMSFADVMRIRDLVQLKKQGQVSENGYQSTLVVLQKKLLSTIGDYRFERVNQGVKKEELDSYLKDGLIDQILYTRAIQKLEQVEKIKRALSEKHSKIIEQTQVRTAELVDEHESKA